MPLTERQAREVYTIIDDFNAKKYPGLLKMRVFGDKIEIHLNNDLIFEKDLYANSIAENFMKDFKMYMEGLETGINLKSLKITLEEL